MRKVSLVGKLVALAVIVAPSIAFAAEEGAAATGNSLMPIGAAIAIGLAALGGTLSQGKAVSSALDSIGRNPSAAGGLFTPMLLGLALIESLVILAFVIAFLLLGK